MSNKTVLYVPSGTGPYTVEGHEYTVDTSDNSITVEHYPHHISSLMALGAVDVKPEEAPVFAERVQSDFGPSQTEHDALRAKFEALTGENEALIKQGDADAAGISLLADTIVDLKIPIGETENVYDAAARIIREQYEAIAAATSPEGDADAPGDTSGSLGTVTEIADPGFTEASDYGDILAWLKDKGAVVPGNISKANALKAVAEIVAKSKGE